MNNLTWLYENGEWVLRNIIDSLAINYTVDNGIDYDSTTQEWLLEEHREPDEKE